MHVNTTIAHHGRHVSAHIENIRFSLSNEHGAHVPADSSETCCGIGNQTTSYNTFQTTSDNTFTNTTNNTQQNHLSCDSFSGGNSTMAPCRCQPRSHYVPSALARVICPSTCPLNRCHSRGVVGITMILPLAVLSEGDVCVPLAALAAISPGSPLLPAPRTSSTRCWSQDIRCMHARAFVGSHR